MQKIILFGELQKRITGKGKNARPISYTTVWRWGKAGKFPLPIRLPGGQVGWYADEINHWFESLPRVGSESDPGANGCVAKATVE
jgi:Prophage CP4-57 regulatory protein (AlpA)